MAITSSSNRQSDAEFNTTVPMWFYQLTSVYVPGEGQTETWSLVVSSPIYGEWRGGFGERAVQASALGINDFATVRTFYHPTILAAMQTKRTIVVKNSTTGALASGIPDINNPNVYELWGSVDNVRQVNQRMEFRVRRFEGL